MKSRKEIALKTIPWGAGEYLEFGAEPNPLNGLGVLQDLLLVVSLFWGGGRFGIFLAEFVINPDEISK
jgi:hypothetical protein